MNKKGFTLIELLGVILLLGIVSSITTALIIDTVNNAKEDAFKESVYAAMSSYTNKESYDDFNNQGEVSVLDLPLKNNNFISGIVKRDENNTVIVIDITDGNFCGNGSRKNLIVQKGDCK